MLSAYGIDICGKHAVIIGRSNIVGKPTAMLLLNSDATVTMTHSKTKNLKDICQSADILIAAAGQAEFVTQSFIKQNAVVIDVGIHKKADGKLCGDVASDAKQIASALSPVPGGVGPMTIAMLMLNTALAAWS
jgi:methylenetetrahydrofolate dehydrogenase (NADP+)/methenyltetrahydrofolate cyclohydrolase